MPTSQELPDTAAAAQDSVDGPFLVAGRESVWVVQAGNLNLFSVPCKDGQPVGARHYVASCAAGEALFGMGPSGNEMDRGLVAVPDIGARVVKTSWKQLAASAGSAGRQPLAGLLDRWLLHLAVPITRGLARPKNIVSLEPGPDQAIAADQAGLPRQGVVWVTPVAGTGHYLGDTTLPSWEPGCFLPLCPQTWLKAVDQAQVNVVDTASLTEHGQLPAALDNFERIFWRLVQRHEQEVRTAESNRLQARADLEERADARAFAQLTALLASPIAGPPVDSADPLRAACSLVAEAAHIELQFPEASGAVPAAPEDAVRRIARASRVHMRRVTLEEGWWKRDSGPLLGFLHKEGLPVALIPGADGSYRLHEPSGDSHPVSPKDTAALERTAFVFYRPFPDRALGVLDLLRFGLRSGRRDLVRILLLGALTAVLGMLTPVLTGRLYELVIPSAERVRLVNLAAALLVASLASALFGIVKHVALLRLHTCMDAGLEAAIWDRVMNLPTTFFRRYQAGDLADRANGISQINKLLSQAALESVLAGIFSLVNFLLLFWYSTPLALIAVVLLAVQCLTMGATGYLRMRLSRLVVGGHGKLMGLVLQLITGIAKLRVAAAERRAFTRWAGLFTAMRGAQYQTQQVGVHVAAFNSVFPVVSSMALFAWVALATEPEARPTLGDLLGFIAAFTAVNAAALGMIDTLMSLVEAVPLFERARPILQTPPEVTASKADPGELTGAVQVSHITFRYVEDGPPILNDVSLDIQSGAFVALVGPSGSGKSTLLRLLLGFETARAGAIYYDGLDLAGLDLQAVRRQIGTVLQAGNVMAGSLFQNIVGSNPLTLDDAWEAARRAGFDKDIAQMPMGMQTVVVQGGGTLSGGQRQRLLIARAVVNKPRILLFDEATSALDNQTQALVSRSLQDLRATRIVIAHRLSTILYADRIYVLEAGRVVQQGTYQELIQQEGLFTRLARKQLASEADGV